jgi:hypothetical protein
MRSHDYLFTGCCTCQTATCWVLLYTECLKKFSCYLTKAMIVSKRGKRAMMPRAPPLISRSRRRAKAYRYTTERAQHIYPSIHPSVMSSVRRKAGRGQHSRSRLVVGSISMWSPHEHQLVSSPIHLSPSVSA